MPIGLAAGVGIGVGVLAGALNGVGVHRLGLPPLVVTLATMAVYRGMAMGLVKADPIRQLPDWFQWLGQGTVGLMPVQLPLLIVIGAVGILALRRSWIGPGSTGGRRTG